MNNKLSELYSDFLFGESNHRDMAIWAFDYLLIDSECSDQDIILLASSTDKDEIIEYTRKILKTQGLLDVVEPSKTIITRNIYLFFPNHPLPSKITDYHENDPEDYDDEAQTVTGFFRERAWQSIDHSSLAGYYLSYLNSESFVYYLPLYLLLILEDRDYGNDTKDSFFRCFDDRSAWWEKRMKQHVSLLTVDQKSTTLSALRFAQYRDRPSSYECRNVKTYLFT